jgi:hypothetical protein
VSPAATLRRRRAIASYADTLRTRTILADTVAELRALARPLLDAGRPELAQPYLDEAEVLAEAAGAPMPTV